MTSYLEFMNATRGAGRSERVRDRGGRAKLHARGREARDLAVSAEPHHQSPGGARGRSPADAHDPQGRADRGGRADASGARASARRHRRGAGVSARIEGKAGWIVIKAAEEFKDKTTAP